MTVPSTEELQRLLDAATPGEWEPRSDPDWGFIDIHGVQSQDGEPVCIDGTPQDCIVLALAPVLAAEVIRLREAIKELRNHYIELMEISDKANIVDSLMMGHALSVVDELNTVLEGDQA